SGKYTGLTCYQAPDSYSAPSRSADCPGHDAKGKWYNNGTSCWSDKYAKSLPPGGTAPMTCPAGYNKKGAFCYVICKTGYTNTGLTCFNAGSTLTTASMTCPDGYFLNKNSGRCYVKCDAKYGAEYTSTAETCYRAPNTLASDSMTCPNGYFLNKELGRCYED